jgi:hypothetical protein
MNEPTDTPIYESKGTIRSLWNTYRIFDDRIELQVRLFFTKIVIRRDELLKVDVYKPPVLRTAFWAVKLDLADLFLHVGIERSSGFFKKLRFTPTNPYEFKRQVIEWMNR